ncbi:MAG: saccharopine dehydrogenase NADP-binding domain-containing protein [Deltaproteobacteria bacterium]|nr:saccharopine dehydrogenase NADP-binding domain-containing protein [Deltaproteobacteria bacterium]
MNDKQFCVIGWPLSFTLSPFIFNTLFDELKLNASYSRNPLKKEELQSFVHSKKVTGFNVTTPYKKEILPYLESLSEEAHQTGCVNLVYEENQKLVGHNTDGLGFIHILKKQDISLEKKNIVIMGAGGLSQTLAYKCSEHKAKHVFIVNRTLEKAQKICTQFKYCEQTQLTSSHLKDLKNALLETDIILNTTPLYFSHFKNLSRNTVLMDFTYDRIETPYEIEFKRNKVNFINGKTFLIAQALYSFQKFFPQYEDIFQYEKKLQNTLNC